MKFGLFGLPTIPGTLEERRRLRPIAHQTERWQTMFDEIVELTRIAEDLGFAYFALPEHFLQTEGLEMGSNPAFFQYIADRTRQIKVGPIGYVLPAWNPLRLAAYTSWLDQLTKGRSFVGLARGFQTRWFNQMTQKLHVVAATSDQSEQDQANRRVFEEVFEILQLAWKDEPFSFKGEFYQYPFPYDSGTPWPAAAWTEECGAPGEIENGRVRRISVVPKPYQKPHPEIFQAFSVSDSTIKWSARKAVVPVTLIPQLDRMSRAADLFQAESAAAGRRLAKGQGLGTTHPVYFGKDAREALNIAREGVPGVVFKYLFSHFGFGEAFREPADEAKWPQGKVMMPVSECTVERMERATYIYCGTVADVRRRMDELVHAADPEYYFLGIDQGLVPFEIVKEQLRIFGEQVAPHYMK